MYDYLDQRLSDLEGGSRMLVWSMRFWGRSLARRECPTVHVAPAFENNGMLDALPHFNMAMMILNRHSREPVAIGPMTCRRVREGEALLLSLLRRRRDPRRLAETINLIVQDGWAGPLTLALQALAQRLAEAGLLPGLPHRLPHQESRA